LFYVIDSCLIFAFYGLAVTGSIALQKFFSSFFFFFLSFLFCGKKFVIWGQNIFFKICLKKNGTSWPSFLDILTSFGVKNVCALFCEIE